MKKYSRIILIVFLSFLTIFGLLKLGDIDVSWQTLTRVKWSWMLVVLVIYYSGIIVRGARWQRILKTMGWSVNYIYAQTLLISGLFISSILPARLGDVGRVVMLRQDYKIPVAQGIASVATERALDVFSILILATIGSIWAIQGYVPPEITHLMIGASLLFAIGLWGLLAIPGREDWLREGSWLKRIIPASLWNLYQKTLDFGFSLIHGVRALGKNPAMLTLAIIESLYIWLCDALVIYFILISIGVQAPVSASLFTAMIGALAAAIPLTPAALGQFDAVLIGTMALFGLSLTDMSLTALLVRFVNFWTFIPFGGLITYFFGFTRVLKLKPADLDLSQTSPSTTLPASTPAEG